MYTYNNDLMVMILKNIAEKNLIHLNDFSESLNIDKIHAEWIINDLIKKGYLRKNELNCSFDCEKPNCNDTNDLYYDNKLKMFLEITEKGRKLINLY